MFHVKVFIKRCFFILPATFSLFHCYGQFNSNFKNISSEQGLSSSECYHIMQDKKGYVWISTSRGVVKYDGEKMKVFTKDAGLADNVVFSTYEDRKGRIWFRAFNGGLCYYYNDSIFTIAASTTLKQLLNKNVISKLYVDENDDLLISIYARTDLVRINHENNYKKLSVEKREGDQMYYRVFKDGANLFSFSTSYKGQRERLNIQSGKRFTNLYVDSLCLFSYSNMIAFGESLYLISTGKGMIIIRNGKEILRKQFKKRIIDIFKSGDSSFWVSIYKDGIYKYDCKDLSKPTCHFLDGYTVSSVLEDYEGAVWFTTLENGVYYKRSLNDVQFNYPGGESSTTIRFLKCKNGKLFFGTDKPSVVAIDSGMNYKMTDRESMESDYILNDIFFYKDLYYLSGYSSLKVYDDEMRFKKKIPAVSDLLSSGKMNNNFKQIAFINDREFVMMDVVNILFVKDLIAEKKINMPSRTNIFWLNRATHEILVGTKAGLYKINPNKTLQLVEEVPPDGFIVSIKDYAGGHLVASQQDGLFFNSGTGYKKLFHKKDILINDFFVDESNNIWIATDNGMFYLEKNGDTFNEFRMTKADGLQSNEISHIACFSGRIWYTTNNGLYYFFKNILFNKPVVPKVDVEQILINNYAGQFRSELPYWQNNINVTVRTLSFLPGGTPSIYYRLVGYDSTWQWSGGGNIINYTNLPPGNYRLEFKGVNSKGIFSDTSQTIRFRILKPYWLTWWFILFEILAASAIISLIIALFVNNIRKKEKKKTETTRLLAEYQMIALRAQINPHFIFNCISSIQSLMLNGKVETAYEYLQKFSKLLRIVLENSVRNAISLKEELEVINLYIVLEQLRFDGSFKYTQTINAERDLSTIKVPHMLLQPIVENAIWHGLLHSDKKEKLLSLDITQNGGTVKIEIRDNGIGREKSRELKGNQDKTSFGQNITSKRIIVMNGETNRSTFDISDIFDHHKKPAGTYVKIELPIILS